MYKISVRYADDSMTVLEVAGLQEAHHWVDDRFEPYTLTWTLNQFTPGVSAARVTLDDRAIAHVELSPMVETITTSEAARMLGCDRRTVMRLATRGDIPVHEYVGPRRERLFARDTIAALAASGELVKSVKWGRERKAAKA